MDGKVSGKVRWFNNDKGYGFILGEDGTEYFVHFKQIIAEGYKALDADQDVEFENGKSEKGPVALNVRAVDRVNDV